MTQERPQVIVGVDTHAGTLHVAVVTECGKPIADQKFAATAAGYNKLLHFTTSHGTVSAVGVEGTGSYGAELSRVLAKEELKVFEVNRPNRQQRRFGESQIHWLPTRQPNRYSPNDASRPPKPKTDQWNASASYGRHGPRP